MKGNEVLQPPNNDEEIISSDGNKYSCVQTTERIKNMWQIVQTLYR